MNQPSRGRRRRRGQRSASRGGPGRADSTRPPAEKVSLETKQPKTSKKLNDMNSIYHVLTETQRLQVERGCTDCDSLVQLMQFREIAGEGFRCQKGVDTGGRESH